MRNPEARPSPQSNTRNPTDLWSDEAANALGDGDPRGLAGVSIARSGGGAGPPTVSSPGREDRKPTTLAVLENSLPWRRADRFPSAGAVGVCYPITLAPDFQWMNLGKCTGNTWGNLRSVSCP